MENISSSASKMDNVMPTGMSVARFGNATSIQPTTTGNVGYSSNAGREFGAPENQAGHNGNQYGSKFLSKGSAGLYQTCNSCGDTGHSSMNCSSVKISGVGCSNIASSGPGISNTSIEWFKCHQPGHWVRNCPGLNTTTTYGSSKINPGRYGVSDQELGHFWGLLGRSLYNVMDAWSASFAGCWMCFLVMGLGLLNFSLVVAEGWSRTGCFSPRNAFCKSLCLIIYGFVRMCFWNS